MDYKELIEQLRELLPPKVDYAEMVGAEPIHYGKSFVYEDPESYIIEQAAAIETLLVEREAAINMLHGECHACKHNAHRHNVGKCATCLHETAQSVFPKEQRGGNWEWRGPTLFGGLFHVGHTPGICRARHQKAEITFP